MLKNISRENCESIVFDRHALIWLVKRCCFVIPEKIKTFLKEFYEDASDGGKNFKYEQQLVSVFSRVVCWCCC